MVKQTTVRLPDDLATEVAAIARVRGSSVNQLIIDSLSAEIDRVRKDRSFAKLVRDLVAQDRELLERLAR